MRIIAGTRARAVLLPPRDLRTRPITDRVKESLFSILTPRLDHARVVDLFCGTGSLGLEAISRQADWAVMVDRDRDALERLRRNIAKLDFGKQACVVSADTFRSKPEAMLRRALGPLYDEQSQPDLVFVDPPFRNSRVVTADSPVGGLLTAWADVMASRGLMVVRHERRVALESQYGAMALADRREYGSMAITFLEQSVE